MNLIEDINHIESALSTKTFRWRRYWAKQIDLFIVFVAVTFSFSFVMDDPSSFMVYAIVVAGVVAYETTLLAKFRTTPGKKLLGISVAGPGGAELSFDDALARSWYCQLFGNGFCVPTLSMMMNVFSFRELGKTGKTKWDEKAGTTVRVIPVSVARKVAAGAVIIGFYALFIAIGILASQAGA